MDFIENLGVTIEEKTITIQRLSKGGYVILGTPKLSFTELNEVLGVVLHQIDQNTK